MEPIQGTIHLRSQHFQETLQPRNSPLQASREAIKSMMDTTAATASGTATLVGVEAGDDVFLGGSPVFTFASANVGTGITIKPQATPLVEPIQGTIHLRSQHFQETLQPRNSPLQASREAIKSMMEPQQLLLLEQLL